LLAGSPTIDAGNNALIPNLTPDQRGFMRIVDGDLNGTATVDIGAFEVQAPTASGVSVSGRVVEPNSKCSRTLVGIARAVVYITNEIGELRTAKTNAGGYYRFEGVASGKTYIFSVYAKHHQFNSQVVTITEDLDDLTFTAQK
jgi:hypothetical protein